MHFTTQPAVWSALAPCLPQWVSVMKPVHSPLTASAARADPPDNRAATAAARSIFMGPCLPGPRARRPIVLWEGGGGGRSTPPAARGAPRGALGPRRLAQREGLA